MKTNRLAPLAGAIVAAWLAGAAVPSAAQIAEDVPPELEGVGITEKLDTTLPLDLIFWDEEGREVALGKYFRPDRPVVLNFVYFDCPMLCNLLVDGMVATMKELDWTPGDEYAVVTVSIDPRDTPEKSTVERDHYIGRLDRPGAAEGWHFLTGNEKSIERLTDAIGFRYRFDAESQEYMHAAAIYVATPEGRLSRYLYGVMFEPQTLRLSLVEASGGGIGSTADQLLLFCFAYDHTEGRYGPAAFKIMRMGASLTVVILGMFLAAQWKRGAHRKSAGSMGAQS
jgi:protein SCO1/2